MSKKHVSWLAVLTVVFVVIAILLPGETERDTHVEHQVFLPGLEAQVNDIAWLRISAGGEILATAVREGDRWVIEEADSYRADWPQLQELLSGLASAVVLEAKTSNPDYYDRLGVEDPSVEGASGILVEFAADSGLPAVIVGNTASGREGHYLRLADSKQSVLVDRELDLPREAGDWLDREVVDISDDEVVEVEIRHPDGETVLAKKVSADDDDFVLQGLQDGFEPTSSWAVNSLAGTLSSLRLDAVAPAEEIDWSGAVHFRLLTADGLNLETDLVEVASDGDESAEHWLRLKAGTWTTAVESGLDEEAAAETAERAGALNGRVSGWAYRVPKYTFDAMNKRMEDLVREVETDE